MVNTDTGMDYESLTKAAEDYGVSLASMHRWVQGRKHNGVYRKPKNKEMWQWYEEKDV